MNKNETIIAVMEAFDAAERKTRENQALKDRIDRMNLAMASTGSYQTVSEDIYEYGRRAIWEKYGEGWYAKGVRSEDVCGGKKYEGFDEWAERVFDKFPDFMSRNDFMEEFATEAAELYDAELAKAMGE